MITISILTLKNATVASIADCRYVFTMVNRFLEEKGKKFLFNVQLVGLTQEVKYYDGSFSIRPNKQIAEVDETDLMKIPSLTTTMLNHVQINKDYTDGIIDQY